MVDIVPFTPCHGRPRQDKAIETRQLERRHVTNNKTNTSSALNHVSSPSNILQNIYYFLKLNINSSMSLGGRNYKKNK